MQEGIGRMGGIYSDRSRTGTAPVKACEGVCFLLSNPRCGRLTGVAVTPGTPETFLNRHRTSSPKTISCTAPRRRTNPRDPGLFLFLPERWDPWTLW